MILLLIPKVLVSFKELYYTYLMSSILFSLFQNHHSTLHLNSSIKILNPSSTLKSIFHCYLIDIRIANLLHHTNYLSFHYIIM